MLEHYRRCKNTFYALGVVTFLTPLCIFAGIAFKYYKEAQSIKFLIIMAVAAGVLFLVDCIRHAKFRASAWVLLTGLVYVANTTTLQLAVYITTGCVILDEFVFTPLYKHYTLKYKMRKEIEITKEE